MDKFETNFLDSYTNDALLDEIRRVADLSGNKPLTQSLFKKLSGKVSPDTIKRRFGGWKGALQVAGVEHLYAGTTVTMKMKEQPARRMTNEQLIHEMRRVLAEEGTPTLTAEVFDHCSKITRSSALRARFGSWPAALKKARIEISNLGKRYTDKECLENLVNVWTHYGRQPGYKEMSLAPSLVGPGAYVVRWGTWRKALKAFEKWASAEIDDPEAEQTSQVIEKAEKKVVTPEDRHEIPTRLRWRVVVRDRFRCVACGRSPANDLTVELHVDHIMPWRDGGKTVLENLQTLCRDCNLGKGRSHVEVR